MPTLTIATCTHPSAYSQEPDDVLLQAALHREGIATDLVAWDNQTYNWSRPDLVLLRSTWDYPLRSAAFLAFVEGVSQLTTICNPAHLVRWNLQKTYLLDLHLRGVPIIPTAWLPAQSPVALAPLMQAHGWGQVVIKPVIGTSSREAQVVSFQTVEAGQRHLTRLLSREAVMVQPFLPAFYATGEHALIFINGIFTHAMRKRFTLMEGLD
jgi:glutathione synthase/RimK-type ligase-like ATP-grasp enzyme